MTNVGRRTKSTWHATIARTMVTLFLIFFNSSIFFFEKSFKTYNEEPRNFSKN